MDLEVYDFGHIDISSLQLFVGPLLNNPVALVTCIPSLLWNSPCDPNVGFPIYGSTMKELLQMCRYAQKVVGDAGVGLHGRCKCSFR